MTTTGLPVPLVRQPADQGRAVELAFREGVAVLTLARPASRHALSAELLDELEAQAQSAVARGARALVITSTGRTFCSGGDLGGVTDALSGAGIDGLEVLVDQLHRVISTLRALPVPVVAAVNGTAVGAGMALAMASDVRVLGRSGAFVTGYLGVGASPDGGTSYHLARALGAPQALASFLLNRRLPAEELLAKGLVDEVVDDAALLGRALELATELSVLSSRVVAAVRELVDSASRHGLKEHLDKEKAHFLAVARTEEFRGAVAPFARTSS